MNILLFLTVASLSSAQQYFQTSPELFAGPTPTGLPAFLAQTNPAPFASVSTYVPPQPLETQVPIQGAPDNATSIFQMHGQLSHYFPNPIGFGVDEYPLPKGANISALYMLSRHGSRYPTTTPTIVQKFQNYTYKATGALSFLNDWTYMLGQQILVPVGKQELFDSGTLHQYMYGHLYPNNGSKIIARSTTQDRMIQSAEYFLAGFFGLHWPDNATLEVIIEQSYFNNSLAGYFACNNSNLGVSTGGTNASIEWYNVYLADAYKRLSPLVTFDNSSINVTVTDVFNMQSLCAYETVALGYSAFCDLFTYEEWQGYEYAVDISFAGNNAFQSPTGRAVGISWVQELRARLQHQYLKSQSGSANLTLDGMATTFPLDQALNFDFSHDTNIMSILTAFGFTQFNQFLPTTKIIPHDLIVSHLEPFGARLDIELINTPQPVSSNRTNGTAFVSGPATTYVHFLLNQRTLPLGYSFGICGYRDDGWCELGAFLNATANAWALSDYENACFGDYPVYPYGAINNGAPAGGI